jgi:hypothetical protein
LLAKGQREKLAWLLDMIGMISIIIGCYLVQELARVTIT